MPVDPHSSLFDADGAEVAVVWGGQRRPGGVWGLKKTIWRSDIWADLGWQQQGW
jgi:hypothetical protein